MRCTAALNPVPMITPRLIWLLALCSIASAEMRFNGLFTDNLGLRRKLPASVWGAADPGEALTLECAGQNKTTAAAPVLPAPGVHPRIFFRPTTCRVSAPASPPTQPALACAPPTKKALRTTTRPAPAFARTPLAA